MLNSNFLSPRNLTNLVLQIAAMGTISVGIVLVLLLGEIDLAVGSVSGLCAAVMAVLNVRYGLSAAVAVSTAIVVGAAIGLLHGAWVTRLRVPSFVVTLAGLLAWQGALLYVLGSTGSINLSDRGIVALANTFFPSWVGLTIAVASTVAYGLVIATEHRMRRAAGLVVGAPVALAVRVLIFGVVLLAVVAILSADRGVPLGLLILVALVVVFEYVSRRTRFGRHIFAVGGNAEAAGGRASTLAGSGWRCSAWRPSWRRAAVSWAPPGCWPSTRHRVAATFC